MGGLRNSNAQTLCHLNLTTAYLSVNLAEHPSVRYM